MYLDLVDWKLGGLLLTSCRKQNVTGKTLWKFCHAKDASRSIHNFFLCFSSMLSLSAQLITSYDYCVHTVFPNPLILPLGESTLTCIVISSL